MKRLLPLFFIITLHGGYAFAGQSPFVQSGRLDLHNHNWQEQEIIELNGQWEFYPGSFIAPGHFADASVSAQKKYIEVPSFWNKNIRGIAGNKREGFGFATYRIVISCPGEKENLSLKLLTVACAYTLYINGREVLARGVPGADASSTTAGLKPAVISLDSAAGIIDIVIHVSNFSSRNGGVWDFITLGRRQDITDLHDKEMALGLFVSGAFFIACAFYFILFLHFTNRLELLFFSLLCFIVMARSLSTGEIPLYTIADPDWSFIRRTEFISLYCSVPAMAAFSYYLFPLDFSRKVLLLLVAGSSPFILLSIFASHYIYTYPVQYYQLLMLAASACGFYVYIKALKNKRPGSLIFFSGFLVFILCVFNDILYANLIIETVPLFYAGLAVFVVALSLILARQFAGAFRELYKSNTKLSGLISDLNFKNDEIKNKNEELQKINHELDSFVNRTSHDLQGPVTSVLGLIDVIKDENNPDVLHTYMDMQQRTLLRMDDMIKDIMNFSKNKRLDIQLQEIHFEKIITDALEDSRFYNHSEDLERKVRVEQPFKFFQDETRIKIIINNLVSNAVKYADIAKGNPFVQVNADIFDGTATISVADNGIGIEERHLDKIFTMFYRATSSVGGSGLGLYIVKETVEKIGGSITLVSKKGEGTKVTVIIPGAKVLG